jgi:hypothetical protein
MIMQRKQQVGKPGLAASLLAVFMFMPAFAQQPAATAPAKPAPAFAPMGSGFFITSNGYFVTCCRVIKNAEDVSIQYAGRLVNAKVAAFDVESDVALLKAEGGPFACLPIEDPQNMVVGDAVHAAGIPTLALTGAVPAFASGTLKGLTGPRDDPRFLAVQVPVQSANYGGPLLDKNGNVVGIIGQANAAIHYPIKALFIDPLFDNTPDARNGFLAKSEAPPPPKELERRATAAVGQVMLPIKITPRPVAVAGYSPEHSSGFKEPPFTYKFYEGGNLLRNGTFSNGLDGWRYKYDLDGESWYTNNHNHLQVITDETTRQTMLKLSGTHKELQVPGQGVKVDAFPIPVKSTDKFKLSCWAKTTGPNCRILAYGYKWKPGMKPHPNPILPELRECYHSVQLYFSAAKLNREGPAQFSTQIGGGDFGGVTREWKQATVIFPDRSKWKATTTSDMHGRKISIGEEKWNSVEFLSIHLLAIGGSPGDLFVRDLRIEKVQ